MIEIPLSAIPNQSFTITLDNVVYNIALRWTGTIMAIDITRSNVVIVQGMRCNSAYPLIPYSYLSDGNFVFVTQNDEYPIYTQFGVTQVLVYASQAEIAALPASN